MLKTLFNSLSEYAIIIQKMKGIAQMAVYKSKYRLGNRDVDMHSKLRTSALFTILQEAASQHCIELGFGPAFTEKRNLIWVITRQKAEINRLPVYEEEILLETWPGPTKHVIFPRYYKISDIRGNVLINASSVWTLVDSQTRTLAAAGQHGIDLCGTYTGDEISLPRAPQQLATSLSQDFTVPYSYLDINGHMNNTRYFDLAEDNIISSAAGDKLRMVSVEYNNEARLHDKLNIQIGSEGKKYYITGDTDKPVFKMYLDYSL